MKKFITASLVILSLTLFIAGCKSPADNQSGTNSNAAPIPGDPIKDNEFLKSLKMPEANVGDNPFTGKTFTSEWQSISFDDEYCELIYSTGSYTYGVKYTYKYDSTKKFIALNCAGILQNGTNYVSIEDYYNKLKEELWIPENEDEAKKMYEERGSDKTWEEWKEGQRKEFCLPVTYTWSDLVYALNGEILPQYAEYQGVKYLSYEITDDKLNFAPYIPNNPTLKDLYCNGTFYIEGESDKYWLECESDSNIIFELVSNSPDDYYYDCLILTKITDEKLYLQSFYRKNYIIEIPYKCDFSSKDIDEWKISITLDGEETDCDLLFYHALIVEEGYTLS